MFTLSGLRVDLNGVAILPATLYTCSEGVLVAGSLRTLYIFSEDAAFVESSNFWIVGIAVLPCGSQMLAAPIVQQHILSTP